MRTIHQLSRDQQSRLLRTTDFQIGTPADEELEAQAYLREALLRADRAVADWKENHLDELTRLKILCGDELMAVHGKLSRTCRDLAETAFDLFKHRIAALGLADIKTRTLYAGSADYERYEAPAAPPHLDDVKLGFLDDAGPRYYIEKPPAIMAQLLQQWGERDAELAALLKSARAELTKARKVSQAA